MEEFFVAIISIEECGAGILRENDRAVSECGIPRCLTLDEVKRRFRVGRIATAPNSAFLLNDGLLYVGKGDNPDLLLAVRTALCHGAQGVVIPFGNNGSRPYIREGRAYTTKEMTAAVGEIKRLAPLFGRKFRAV